MQSRGPKGVEVPGWDQWLRKEGAIVPFIVLHRAVPGSGDDQSL